MGTRDIPTQYKCVYIHVLIYMCLYVCVYIYVKLKVCIGTEPSALLYIGILVTSTTTGHGGSVVSALLQAKGRGSIPSCVVARAFFPTIFPFQPQSSK